MRQDAETILRSAIQAVLPDEAVRRALSGRVFPGKVYLVAAGESRLPDGRGRRRDVPGLAEGVVITKYGHLGPPIGNLRMLEAGHPTPDENSFLAARRGAPAGRPGRGRGYRPLPPLGRRPAHCFESPLIPGANYRYHRPAARLRGGYRRNQHHSQTAFRRQRRAVRPPLRAPGSFRSSSRTIIGDPLDMIASGPAVPDRSTSADARRVAEKYHLRLRRKSETASGHRNAQNGRQCDHHPLRQRPGAGGGGRTGGGKPRLYPRFPHRPVKLRSAGGRAVSGLHPQKPRGHPPKPRLPGRRGDGRPPDRQRQRRPQPGTGPGRRPRDRRDGKRRPLQRRQRRDGRPDRRGRPDMPTGIPKGSCGSWDSRSTQCLPQTTPTMPS